MNSQLLKHHQRNWSARLFGPPSAPGTFVVSQGNIAMKVFLEKAFAFRVWFQHFWECHSDQNKLYDMCKDSKCDCKTETKVWNSSEASHATPSSSQHHSRFSRDLSFQILGPEFLVFPPFQNRNAVYRHQAPCHAAFAFCRSTSQWKVIWKWHMASGNTKKAIIRDLSLQHAKWPRPHDTSPLWKSFHRTGNRMQQVPLELLRLVAFLLRPARFHLAGENEEIDFTTHVEWGVPLACHSPSRRVHRICHVLAFTML